MSQPYITESLIDWTRAKRIAGSGCHGHVHLNVESKTFEPLELDKLGSIVSALSAQNQLSVF